MIDRCIPEKKNRFRYFELDAVQLRESNPVIHEGMIFHVLPATENPFINRVPRTIVWGLRSDMKITKDSENFEREHSNNSFNHALRTSQQYFIHDIRYGLTTRRLNITFVKLG